MGRLLGRRSLPWPRFQRGQAAVPAAKSRHNRAAVLVCEREAFTNQHCRCCPALKAGRRAAL